MMLLSSEAAENADGNRTGQEIGHMHNTQGKQCQ